jgi:cobalt-zinc-cadmium efflux system membrane fusion protein
VTVLMPEVAQAAGTYLGAALRLQAHEQRRQQLLGLKVDGLMRLADLAETEARLAEARATQLEARAILQAAGWKTQEPAQLAAQLESRAGRITLRAPIRGTVMAVHGTLGQRWEPGAPPIAHLVGGGDAELHVEARLASGLPKSVRYFFRTAAGLQLPLRLLSAAPVVDGRDGTVTTWFAFAAPPAPGSITSGLTGKVVVEPEEVKAEAATQDAGKEKNEKLVVVPRRAVHWQHSQAEVQRVPRTPAEAPQAVPVRVVMNLGAELVVAAALTPGEEVVLLPVRENPTGEQP